MPGASPNHGLQERSLRPNSYSGEFLVLLRSFVRALTEHRGLAALVVEHALPRLLLLRVGEWGDCQALCAEPWVCCDGNVDGDGLNSSTCYD